MAKTSLLSTIVKLVFPVDCMTCGKESDWLCNDCLRNYQRIRTGNCFFCTKTAETGVCTDCQQKTAIDGVIPVLPYGQLPGIRRLIETAGRQDGRDALRFITETFRQRILRLLPEDIETATFTPISKNEEKGRGYNPARIMAGNLADNEMATVDLFEKTKDTPKQSRLKKRLTNAPRIYRLRTKKLPKTLVIVDDVFTDSDTLEALAKLAKNGGVEKIWVVAIAHG